MNTAGKRDLEAPVRTRAGDDTVRVALEMGSRRVFASALDWPGWSRSGKGEEAAMDTLLAYIPRYARVLARTPWALPASPRLDIVERVSGGAGTNFGAPGMPAADESRPTTAADGERLSAILAASWSVFDEVAAAAPEELRKGPRGGGRDRSKIVGHVMDADRAYGRQLGVRYPPFAADDRSAYDALRSDVLAVLRTPSDGSPVVERGWRVRFATRYIAWHALDHAWEIEDRSS